MTRQELLATAKPILFNTEMVGAILEGGKTVTRRIIKPQPQDNDKMVFCFAGSHKSDIGKWHDRTKKEIFNPPFRGDDILYVRETWQHVYNYDDNDQPQWETGRYIYLASPETHPNFTHWIDSDTGAHKDYMPWKPSIHMPKEAARIFLRVTNVRVEKLQAISTDDAVKEGAWGGGLPDIPLTALGMNYPDAPTQGIAAFARLWDKTVKTIDTERYGWNANPWVWVIDFERVDVDDQ